MFKQFKRNFATNVIASFLIITPLTSFSQSKDELNIASLAATCAACHGTQGNTAAGSAVVSLAGMPAANMIMQMKAFKDGSRPATVMHQLSKGYSDAQVAQIASYFAAQKK